MTFRTGSDRLWNARNKTFLLFMVLSATGAPLLAQQRGILTGTIRSARGDSLPHARVHAVGTGVDTTVRTNVHGQFSLVAPIGTVHLEIAMIGFLSFERDVTVGGATVTSDVQLIAVAQQIAAVNVRDSWTGIRGIVGDSSTMQPLPGVVVATLHRGKRVVTDSTGQFEFDLPKAEPTILNLHLDGYQSRAAHVAMVDDHTPYVVLFMNRGKDRNYVKSALIDLDHRAAWAATNAFTVDRDVMARYGAQDLAQGIVESGMVARKGLNMGNPDSICLFVNGEPAPALHLDAIRLSDVDFVEVYADGADEGGTLEGRWPRGRTQCGGVAR